MQIIIPMSGQGQRFKNAGYLKPKPLIEVNNKPIIAHVLDLFPGEKDVTFICNEEHLEKTNMEQILEKYCPTGKVIPIAPHKLGPVYAVYKVFDFIDNDKPSIVNYCDFSCYWNYDSFKNWLSRINPDGCLPAYKGFHPHSLAGNNYAFIKEENGWLTKIQEKKPFTKDKLNEYASSGTYYFSKGEILKKYFKKTIDLRLKVNKEYYCSVAYNLLIEEGLSVSIYDLQHFMQWGTPEDLIEYERWSDAFDSLSRYKEPKNILNSTTLIPMAGKGMRFKKENYKLPKPLLEISGIPMVIQAVRSLPESKNYHFVVLEKLFLNSKLNNNLSTYFKKFKVKLLSEVTAGQCSTCLKAIDDIPLDESLTISACDNAVLFDEDEFLKIYNDQNIDVIVWVTRGHPEAKRKPEMFGWVKVLNKKVKKISVKKPLNNPALDPMVIGTFTFKRAEVFKECAENLIKRKEKINGEFYVDSCINDAVLLGYNCQIFTVNHYFSWGTPNELKTFEYWQSCFHKWNTHKYTWSKDPWREKNNSFLPAHLEEKF